MPDRCLSVTGGNRGRSRQKSCTETGKLMNDEYISVLESSLLFKNISGAEIERLVHSSQTGTKEYKKGERVFSESDRPDKLLILLSGKLLVAKDTVSGKRLVLATIDQPGDLFGEVYPFVEKEEYDMYVETAQKSVVFSIGLDFFMKRRAGTAK